LFQNLYLEYKSGDKKNIVVWLWDDEKGLLTFPYNDFDYAYRRDPNGKILALDGKRVTKVKHWDKDDPLIYESDVPRETRVLTDLYLNNDEPSTGHRLVIFDIEVSDKGGYPSIEKAGKEILSIALEDVVTGQEYIFILDKAGKLSDLTHGSIEVIVEHTEEALLSAFLNTWNEINPTIITGWNIDKFDIPYLYRRISAVLSKKEAKRLSPISKVKWSNLQERYRIAGISSLDYLKLYKKFTYQELPNYRLGTVGEFEVDMPKIEYEGTLYELFENDIETAIDYNMTDVRIVSALDKKRKFIELVRGVCSVGHVPYEDYTFSSRWLEGALLTDLHREGKVAPNKDPNSRQLFEELKASRNKGFAGAYVKKPKTGRHEWIYSLDLKSLYPSIVMSLNISPETKVGKVINWDLAEHLTNKLDEYVIEDIHGSQTTVNRERFTDFMENSKFAISSNGILYRTDQPGLLPKVLDRWFDERLRHQKKLQEAVDKGDEEQEEYWSMRQHIQKIFLNSLYGVLGLPVFRFYDVDNALAVTATGQDVIKTSAKFVNGAYNDKLNDNGDYCIYIDTDSLYFSVMPFVHTDSNSPKKLAIETANQMEVALNEFYDRMAKQMFFVSPDKHRFLIKGETIASAGFWIQKKRYALKKVYDLETNQDVDKVIVKGLDVVRSTFPQAFRKFMRQIIRDILDYNSKSIIDEKVLEFRSNMPNMDVPSIARNTAVKNIEKWLLPNQTLTEFMSSTPAHVKAAITYNQLLKELKLNTKHPPIRSGSKIKWVYLKDNPYHIDQVAFIGDTTDAPQIMELIEKYMDYGKIFDTEFSHKLQDFYSALGWGKIPTNVNQNAEKFFAWE